MKYSRRQNVVARTVAGEHILVPVNQCTKKVFTLNNVGIRLWEEIETPRSKNELTEFLMERYRITRETAQADVQVFLDDMVRLELIDLLT
jgi:hypothetical protein